MLRISFETCNSAFGETDEDHRDEVASMLRNIAYKVKRGDKGGVVMDSNGNKVGSWDINRGCCCEMGKGK